MNLKDWQAIVADIEKNVEGDAYSLNVHMKSGTVHRHATWQAVTPTALALGVCDSPPIYTSIEAIEAVEIAA